MRLLLCFSAGLILMVQACAIRTIPGDYLTERTRVQRPHALAVFMDGTNNKSNSNTLRNTHVKAIHGLVDTGIRSLYIEGVGTRGKLLGGLKGVGTKARVVRAYRFLSEHYQPGDSIYLFGFSRGANQCRILSNLIATVGVMDLENVKGDDAKMKIVKGSYHKYRRPGTAADRKRGAAEYLNSWNNSHPAERVPFDTTSSATIEMMGLWETVEAFKLDKKATITPRKDHLNQIVNVKKVFHAVAFDDNRALTYTPVLLTAKDVIASPRQKRETVVEEVWFNGSHRDVGGGHKKGPLLQSVSLKWMLAATKKYGLFNDTSLAVNVYAPSHNMLDSKFMKILFKNENRDISGYHQAMSPAFNGKLKIHQSVLLRLRECVIADFKSTRGRSDWFDLPPFDKCFEKKGSKRIFKEDCCCIEVISDQPE